MRSLWRLSVVVIVLTLAPMHVAWADCAWLLWLSFQSQRTESAIQRAFENQRACEDAIPTLVQRQLKVWRGPYEKVYVSSVDAAVVVAEGMADSPRKRMDGDTLIIRASCWPMGLRPTGVDGVEYAR